VFGERLTAEFDSGVGIGLGWEKRFTDLLRLDANVVYAKLDAKARALGREEKTDTKFLPVMLGLNFRLTPKSKADFHVGPLVAYTFYDSDFKNELGCGANVAVDVPLNDRGFNFTVAVKYRKTKAKVDDETYAGDLAVSTAITRASDIEIDVNPWVFQAGLTWKY
jgi:outer membrane protein W